MGSAGGDDFAKELVIFDDADDGGASGQTCRMALLFSALTMTPIKIMNVMSGDPQRKTQGMTRHLVELVHWFQTQTAAKDAKVYKVGDTTLELTPTQRASSELANTVVPLKGSAKNKYREEDKLTHATITFKSVATNASAVITLQTILPLLLTIGNHSGLKTTREVLIEGATNCPGSPSFEYLKQVFEPALLQYFGIELDCELVKRGWGVMPVMKGQIRAKFTPMPIDSFFYPQQAAKLGITEDEADTSMQQDDSDVTLSTDVEVETEVQKVVATIVAPGAIHEILEDTVRLAVTRVFNYLDEDDQDAIEINTEPSSLNNHVYILLVAHSDTCRWGRDWMNSESMGKRPDLKGFVKEEMLRLCADLEKEVSGASECPVDQFLQDQLVVYQALAKGSSSFQRQKVGSGAEDGAPLDSEHVCRARVTAEKMLGAKFTEGGALCLGAGVKVGEHVKIKVEKKQQLGKQEAKMFA